MGILRNLFKMHFGGWIAMMNAEKIKEISKEENAAFQNMMMTPNDETVSAYIEVLKRVIKTLNDTYGSTSLNSGMQMKYANTYDVIMKTENVSAALKDELGRVYLAMGVVISIN